MNPVERALRDFLEAKPPDIAVALVGGVAVSARTEPRFTRDLDFAVTVTDDAAAEQYVFRMRQLGYELDLALDQSAHSRLSTVRLRRSRRSPFVDLLFASTGIEEEIVAAAGKIEVVAGLFTEVAQVGHLIAMKLVSRDDKQRPQDLLDLTQLTKAADATEWARAEEAVELIEQRGFARKRDLQALLAAWRS